MQFLSWSFYLIVVVFSSACMMYPSGQRTAQVDECGFHVNKFGRALRWKTLPAQLTFHSGSFNTRQRKTTSKVIGEWNQMWREESGQDRDLFEIIGDVNYESPAEIQEQDGINTLAVLDEESNNQCGNGFTKERCLRSVQQGITTISGALSISETDIFINDADYDFYYDGDEDYEDEDFRKFGKYSRDDRELASLGRPYGFFSRLWDSILNLFLFWKPKKEGRGLAENFGSIPSHLVDFESLITHELGHVLGFGHSNTVGSIMRPHLTLGVKRRGLRNTELSSLLCGYGSE